MSANAVPSIGETAARATQAGVQVTTLNVGQWPGAFTISDQVTPLAVRIQNNSAMPVAVRYDRFSLQGSDGRTYRALPLYKMEGEATTTLTVQDYSPLSDVGFGYSGFEVAPYYGPVYPSLDVYDATPFSASTDWTYDLYDTYFLASELPTVEMRARALPEGVLQPGGYVDGYLFFERVPLAAERLAFQYDLMNTQTNQMLGEIEINYRVM